MLEILSSFLTWLTSNTTFPMFCFIILAGFCLWEVWDYKQTTSHLSLIQKFIRVLDTAQEQLKPSLDREDFLLRESGDDIRRFWPYLEGRRTPDGFLAKYDTNKFILLQYPSELTGSIPSSPFKFVPGIFISLGVFGTFWGITVGLQGLNVGGNSEQLLAASSTLLDGMKTAFYTSLVGMTCSIVLTIWQGLLQNFRSQKYDHLRKQLDRVAFMESSERLLARQDTSELAEAAVALKTVSDGLKTLNAAAIGQAVGQEVTPVFAEICEELQQLRLEIGKDRSELIKILVEEQEERLIKPVIEQLENSANLTREASEAVTSLKNELGTITRELSEAVKTIQDFQQGTLTKLQEFSEGLATTLNDFTKNQETIIRDLSKELKDSVIETTTSQTALIRAVGEEAANAMRIASHELQSTLSNLDERLGQFTAGLGDQLEIFSSTLRQEFNAVLRQMVDTITITTQQQVLLIQQTGEEATKTITTASKESAEIIEKIGKTASETLSNSAEQLKETLATIDTEITKMRETVQEELAKFRDDYMKSLETFFEDNDKKLEQILLEYTRRMAENVTRIDEVFQGDYENRVKIHKAILKEVKVVEEFATQVGLTSADRLAQLTSIISAVGTEARQIQDRYDNFVGVLNDGLRTNNEHLTDSLKLLYDHETQFFTKADETVNTLAESLTKAAGVLVASGQQRQASGGDGETAA